MGQEPEDAEPEVEGDYDHVAPRARRSVGHRGPAPDPLTKPPPWIHTMTGRRSSSAPGVQMFSVEAASSSTGNGGAPNIRSRTGSGFCGAAGPYRVASRTRSTAPAAAGGRSVAHGRTGSPDTPRPCPPPCPPPCPRPFRRSSPRSYERHLSLGGLAARGGVRRSGGRRRSCLRRRGAGRGVPCGQRSTACGQRWAKGQPPALGGTRVVTVRASRRARCSSGSGTGAAARSAWV